MVGLASLTTAEIYMQVQEQLQYLRHYTIQKFEKDLLMTFIPFLKVCIWKTFSVTSIIFKH